MKHKIIDATSLPLLNNNHKILPLLKPLFFCSTSGKGFWQAISNTKSKSVAKDPHNFHLHSTSGFEPSATASQALQHDAMLAELSTPKSTSVTEGHKDFRTRVWTLNPEPSWGPRVPVHWAITPGPGVLAFVLKFLLFKGLVLQPPDHVLFSVSLIFEWIPWHPFYFVYLFAFSSNSLPWALALIICNIWFRKCVAIIFIPASPQLETNWFWFRCVFYHHIDTSILC
jgi:hypothetical protein